MSGIHWFPGHMAASEKKMLEILKVIDIVIEVIDARIPVSSRFPLLKKMIGHKGHIIIMNKADLADQESNRKWLLHLKEEHQLVLLCGLQEKGNFAQLFNLINNLLQSKRERAEKKGMKMMPVKIMIAGIPNVGKSTLINRLKGKKVVVAYDKPGVTRGNSWIKLKEDLFLLDTPGILPSRYEDEKTSVLLALVGSIRAQNLTNHLLSEHLFAYAMNRYPQNLKARYAFGYADYPSFIENLGKSAGFVSAGIVNTEKAETRFINDFQSGKLGQMTLE